MSYLPQEKEDADRIAGILREAGATVVQIPGDLRERDYARTLVKEAVEGLGGLDIVVNNGGKQIFNEDVTTLTDEQFDDTFKTNVYAMFWICKEAVPYLSPARRSSTRPRSIQAYSPAPILVTTPRRRRRSTPSPRRSASSSRPRASA